MPRRMTCPAFSSRIRLACASTSGSAAFAAKRRASTPMGTAAKRTSRSWKRTPSSVAGRPRSDESGPEQASQQRVPPGQGLQDLHRRERDVEEEADLRPREGLSQEFRKKTQVVIVDPDAVAFPVDARHEVREALVHLRVGPPLDR